MTPRPTLAQAIRDIKVELKARIEELTSEGRLLEVERLTQRTTFDIEMMETTGSCKGIENYSRYLTGREPGDPPPTLFEYLPENALLIGYSDGLVEPENVYGEEFGISRLKDAAVRVQAAPPRFVADAMMTAAEEWAGTPEQADDMTVIVARLR